MLSEELANRFTDEEVESFIEAKMKEIFIVASGPTDYVYDNEVPEDSCECPTHNLGEAECEEGLFPLTNTKEKDSVITA